jgi:hypothetical protein
VGVALIAEGLARPFVCGRTSCPSRESWCTFEASSAVVKKRQPKNELSSLTNDHNLRATA